MQVEIELNHHAIAESVQKEASKKENRYDIALPQPIIESFAKFLVPELRIYHAGKIKKK